MKSDSEISTDKIIDCSGSESSLTSCSSQATNSTSCDYLKVQCRDPLPPVHVHTTTTAPTQSPITIKLPATTPSYTPHVTVIVSSNEEDGGGLSIPVLAGIAGAIVVTLMAILIAVLLIVILLKRNSRRLKTET